MCTITMMCAGVRMATRALVMAAAMLGAPRLPRSRQKAALKKYCGKTYVRSTKRKR